MISKIKALLIDQDDSYRKRLATGLTKEGVQVINAVSLQKMKFPHSISTYSFNVVLMGQTKKPEEELQILSDLQQQNPSLEVIMLTNLNRVASRRLSSNSLVFLKVKRSMSVKSIASLLRGAIRYPPEKVGNIIPLSLSSMPEWINSAKDEEDLYQRFYYEATEILPELGGFLIAHFDETLNEVSFPFGYRMGKRIHIKSRRGGNSIAEYIFLTKEPLFLPYGDEFFRLKNGLNLPDKNLGFSSSEIIVPMFLGDGKIYGAVFAASYNPETHFTQEQFQTLKSFTAQASVTIWNFIQLKKATQLRDATAKLSSAHGREEVLRAIIRGAHEIVNSDFTGMILHEENGTLRKAQPVIPERFYHKFGIPRQTGGITRTIIDSKKALIIPDTREYPTVKNSVRSAGIKSMLAFPLIQGERVLGVLYTHTFKPRDFVARDVELWSAFATQAAGALDRVIAEERQIRDYQQLVKELGRFDDSTELNQTLTHVATAAKKIFGSDTCRLFYIDPPTGIIVDSAFAKGDREEYHIEGVPREGGSTYYVLHTQKPFYYPDMQNGPQPRSELLNAGLVASASLPLWYDGRAIGVLHCNYFFKQPTFDEHFRNMHEAFGGRAGVAISRARRELRINIWQGLAQDVTQCTNVHQLYELFTTKAHQAMRADITVFYPYNPAKADTGHLPLQDDCVIKGELRSIWQQPRGGRGGGVFNQIAQRSPTLIVNDLSESKGKYNSHFTDREDIKAFIAIRLKVIKPGSKVPTLAGILFLNYRKPVSFEKVDFTRLNNAADLIAAGILNLRLQEYLNASFEIKNRQLSAMIDIFREHESASNELNLNQIAERAGNCLGIDALTILEYETGMDKFINRGLYGLLHPDVKDISPRRRFKTEYMHKEIPTIVPNVQKDSLMRSSKFVKREKIRSTVVYPLRSEGELLGLFFANYRHHTNPSEEDIKSIGLFADVAAHVLHQARLNTRLIEKQLKEDRHKLLVWFSMVEDMWQHNLVQKASAIRNYAQTLMKQLQLELPLPEGMATVPERIREIDHLAEDIANAPPRVPHDSEMTSELIPLASLLLEIADRERHSLHLKGDLHRIEVDVKSLGGVQIDGYRRWLIFIIENLLQNAYVAMSRGGKVTITGTRRKNLAEIRITDTGKGIPKALRDKIFRERFTSGQRRSKGLGVGTILVTTLVEEHQGTIQLERPGPGDTTILIRLPIHGQITLRQ